MNIKLEPQETAMILRWKRNEPDAESWEVEIDIITDDGTDTLIVKANVDTIVASWRDIGLIPFKTYAWPSSGNVEMAMFYTAARYYAWSRDNL